MGKYTDLCYLFNSSLKYDMRKSFILHAVHYEKDFPSSLILGMSLYQIGAKIDAKTA